MSKTFCELYPEECIGKGDTRVLQFGNTKPPQFGRKVPRRNITDRVGKGIDIFSDNEKEREIRPQQQPSFGTGKQRPVVDKSTKGFNRKPKAPAGGLTRPIKASHSELTGDERMKAKMLEAAKIAELESKTTNRVLLTPEERQARLQRGFDKAQRYLDREGIPYIVEPEISNAEGLVLINKETGIPKVAFRGTNFKNVSDLKTDLAIIHGAEDLTPQFRSANQIVEATTEIYGAPEELLGFSLGGAKAITVGENLNIKTTTFNPAVGPQHLKNVPLNSGDKHTLIRITEDPVSALAGFKPSAFKIKSLLPLQEPKWLNPESGMAIHDLANFSQTGIRRSNNTEVIAEETMRLGQRHAELVGIDSAKSAIERGESLTDWLRDFSPPDVNEDGTFSNRIYDDAKLFQMWEKAGGDITVPEADSIIENSERAIETGVTTDEFVLPDYEIEEIINKTPAQREVVVQNEAQELVNYHENLQERMSPAYATRDAIKASLSPANLGIGVVGGYLGEKAAGVIDPNMKAGIDAHQALSGGLGGAATAGAIATLGGEALTASALAPAVLGGGAGAVAGYETNKAVANSLQKAGANRDTIESISDISGGAVGGAATSAVGIGTAALLGAEIGELGGPAGVALGAGVGALFGVGQYAVGAIKRSTPKAKAKREEAKRLEQIANEAGYDSYADFQVDYANPEEYYKQVRIEQFGYDPMEPVVLTPEEQQARMEQERQEQLEQTAMFQSDPYFRYQQRRRGQYMGTLGPTFDFSQEEIQQAIESRGQQEQAVEQERMFYGPVQETP